MTCSMKWDFKSGPLTTQQQSLRCFHQGWALVSPKAALIDMNGPLFYLLLAFKLSINFYERWLLCCVCVWCIVFVLDSLQANCPSTTLKFYSPPHQHPLRSNIYVYISVVGDMSSHSQSASDRHHMLLRSVIPALHFYSWTAPSLWPCSGT